MNFLEMPSIDKNFEVWDEQFFQTNKTRPDSDRATLIMPDNSWFDMLKGNIESDPNDLSWYAYYPADSYFKVFKFYYPDTGFIYQKSVELNSGYVRVGFWYEFDREGNFVGAFNDDDHCGFKFKDVFSYCIQRKIPLTIGKEILPQNVRKYNTDIYRNIDENGKCTWEIKWQIGVGRYQVIILDGDTGKEISKKEGSFIL